MKTKAIHILVAFLCFGLGSEAIAQTTRPNAFVADLETTWSEWQQDPNRMAFWETRGWVFEPTIKQLQDRNAPWWPVEAHPWEDGVLKPSELPTGVEPDPMNYQTWNVEGGTFHLVSLIRLETLYARSNGSR